MNDEGDDWEDDESLDNDSPADASDDDEDDAILHEQDESNAPRDNI
ncbi:hypothetical protein [Desulfosarcina variabilis]